MRCNNVCVYTWGDTAKVRLACVCVYKDIIQRRGKRVSEWRMKKRTGTIVRASEGRSDEVL